MGWLVRLIDGLAGGVCVCLARTAGRCHCTLLASRATMQRWWVCCSIAGQTPCQEVSVDSSTHAPIICASLVLWLFASLMCGGAAQSTGGVVVVLFGGGMLVF